jgi:hypothetical protein
MSAMYSQVSPPLSSLSEFRVGIAPPNDCSGIVWCRDLDDRGQVGIRTTYLLSTSAETACFAEFLREKENTAMV